MKTINTTSEFRSSEKGFGFNTKIRILLTIDGIFNIPLDLKKASVELGRITYTLYFLGQKIHGGKFSQRLLSEEEIELKEAEIQVQAKKKTKEAIVFEDNDIPLQADLNRDSISQYFEELENERKFSSIKFAPSPNSILKFEEDLRESDLVLFEESILLREGANLYLVISMSHQEEDGLKKSSKIAQESVFQTQVFSTFISLQSFRNNEISFVKDRYFFTKLPQNEGQIDLMYIKFELKTDISVFHEFKSKFNFEIADIFKREEKTHFQTEIIEKNFLQLTKKFYKDFSSKFDELLSKTSEDTIISLTNNLNTSQGEKGLIFVRETSEIARRQLEKENLMSNYKGQVSHLIASQVYQKYKIKDLKGVYFNNNDQIYGEMFNKFSSLAKKFKRQHLKVFMHERGFSVPQNSLSQEDYFKALERQTSKSAIAHFENLARVYFLLEFETEAQKSNERVLSLDEKNQEVFYLKLFLKLARKEFSDAELLILTANSKWSSSFEANYRLLLFYIERQKTKETIFMLKYLLEKFPYERLFYSWLIILNQKLLENSSLTGYFQAKIARIIEKHNASQIQNSLPANFLLDNEIYHYDFLNQFKKVNSSPIIDKNSPNSKAEVIPENQPLKVSPSPPLLSTDDFYTNEAKLALSWGFSKAANMLLEQIEGKNSLDFKLLEYQVAKLEEPQKAIEKLNELHFSQFSKTPLVLYELFEKLVNIGFLNEEDENSLISELFDNFQVYSENQRHFICYHSASILFKQQKCEEAIQILLKAIENWPHSVPEWILLGKCLCFLNKYDEGLKALAYANLLDNLNYEGLVLLACCLLKIGDKCRIEPVLQDIRNIGIEDGVLTMTLIEKLEEYGYSSEAEFFKRNFYAMKNMPST